MMTCQQQRRHQREFCVTVGFCTLCFCVLCASVYAVHLSTWCICLFCAFVYLVHLCIFVHLSTWCSRASQTKTCLPFARRDLQGVWAGVVVRLCPDHRMLSIPAYVSVWECLDALCWYSPSQVCQAREQWFEHGKTKLYNSKNKE